MIEQGSPQWFEARLGKVTASRVSDVIAKTKTGWGASRANLMAQLLCERLTGQAQESYSNAAMVFGLETEPQARSAYELFEGARVELAGFIEHPRIPMSGASPDGLVGLDGQVEIKCPNTATHLDTLLSESIPAKYVPQMQWQMACTGRAWCDFVSFDPRLPSHMRLFVKREMRSEPLIASLEKEVTEFLKELDDKIAALTARYGSAEAEAA